MAWLRDRSQLSPDLILRSVAKRCVSKDGRRHSNSRPSFETRRFAPLLRMRSE